MANKQKRVSVQSIILNPYSQISDCERLSKKLKKLKRENEAIVLKPPGRSGSEKQIFWIYSGSQSEHELMILCSCKEVSISPRCPVLHQLYCFFLMSGKITQNQ